MRVLDWAGLSDDTYVNEAPGAFVDPCHLKAVAYPDSRHLTARIDIYRYAVPNTSFVDWALSHLSPNPGPVLDVGCGPGHYLTRIWERERRALIGLDLSEGMLREIDPAGASACMGDAQAIPFRDGSFDTVLCIHVLYHIADIDLAIQELARVVKREGTVLVATNGAHHHRRLRQLFDDAISEICGETLGPVLSSDRRFRLEEASGILRNHFGSVVARDLLRELVITDVEPVIAYLNSVRSFHETRLPSGVLWDEVTANVAGRVREEIERHGAFRNPVHAGVVVCRETLRVSDASTPPDADEQGPLRKRY
jgi:SAM-dependent methyltransferase